MTFAQNKQRSEAHVMRYAYNNPVLTGLDTIHLRGRITLPFSFGLLKFARFQEQRNRRCKRLYKQ